METRDKDQVVFYYNREKRLERANADARFAMDRHGAKRPGLLRALTATRGLATLFFAMLFMVVAVFVVGFIQGSKNEGTVAGNSVIATAMWFEGHIYVTVKRSSSWLDRIRTIKPAMLEIRAGDGLEYATGIMQVADDDIRLRFQAESSPPRIAVIASVPGSDGAPPDSVELIVPVE